MKSSKAIKHLAGLICAVFSAAIGVHAQMDQKPVLAVLNLSSQTVSQADANTILGFIQQEFFNTKKYKLVERAQVEKLLREMRLQPSEVCDLKCAVDIGKRLGAQKVVNGTLSKLGNAYSIQLMLIDVPTSAIESMQSGLEECPLEQLPGRIPKLINGLVPPGSRPSEAPPVIQPRAEMRPTQTVDKSEAVSYKKKSPWLALTLSIIPGLGQYYNGQIFKGILIDAVVTIGFVFLFASYDLSDAIFDRRHTMNEAAPVFFVVAELGSLIDAPLSAARINRQRARLNAHMLNLPVGDDQSLGLDFGPVYKGCAAKLTFTF
ncbi:MAG: hypothetical protein PHI34_04730 [Acidobacteriota bacterium]|nr:hypothetical protein [Acidobacteriota bacterium]